MIFKLLYTDEENEVPEHMRYGSILKAACFNENKDQVGEPVKDYKTPPPKIVLNFANDVFKTANLSKEKKGF